MQLSYFTRINFVWLLLVVATCVSFAVESLVRGEGSANHVVLVITGVIFIKVRLVFLDFMELRDAPTMLRLTNELWLVGVCAGIVYLYW